MRENPVLITDPGGLVGGARVGRDAVGGVPNKAAAVEGERRREGEKAARSGQPERAVSVAQSVSAFGC